MKYADERSKVIFMRLYSNEEPLKTRAWRVPASLAYRLKQFALNRQVSAESVLVQALDRYMDDQDNAYEADPRTFVGGDV